MTAVASSAPMLHLRLGPTTIERRGLRCVRITDRRWRVTQPGGAIVGYLDERDSGSWVVARMTPDRRSFMELGSHPSFDDAFDSLRRG